MLFASPRNISEDGTKKSSREEKYGDLGDEKSELERDTPDNAHQNERDGEPVRKESTLQWQFVFFSLCGDLEGGTWAETLEYRAPEPSLAASWLRGSLVTRMQG